jgi:hypothetical protein
MFLLHRHSYELFLDRPIFELEKGSDMFIPKRRGTQTTQRYIPEDGHQNLKSRLQHRFCWVKLHLI